jgi:TfoX/Sxy family transcriptional regulator of competence genes
MSTRRETIEALLDALALAGPLSAKAMFGEYALYLDGRVVALVCDDQLFIKPTPGARAALPEAPLAPPYPKAKDHLLASDALDDPEPAAAALRAAAADLPPPRPRKPKGVRGS